MATFSEDQLSKLQKGKLLSMHEATKVAEISIDPLNPKKSFTDLMKKYRVLVNGIGKLSTQNQDATLRKQFTFDTACFHDKPNVAAHRECIARQLKHNNPISDCVRALAKAYKDSTDPACKNGWRCTLMSASGKKGFTCAKHEGKATTICKALVIHQPEYLDHMEDGAKGKGDMMKVLFPLAVSQAKVIWVT